MPDLLSREIVVTALVQPGGTQRSQFLPVLSWHPGVPAVCGVLGQDSQLLTLYLLPQLGCYGPVPEVWRGLQVKQLHLAAGNPSMSCLCTWAYGWLLPNAFPVQVVLGPGRTMVGTSSSDGFCFC